MTLVYAASIFAFRRFGNCSLGSTGKRADNLHHCPNQVFGGVVSNIQGTVTIPQARPVPTIISIEGAAVDPPGAVPVGYCFRSIFLRV